MLLIQLMILHIIHFTLPCASVLSYLTPCKIYYFYSISVISHEETEPQRNKFPKFIQLVKSIVAV